MPVPVGAGGNTAHSTTQLTQGEPSLPPLFPDYVGKPLCRGAVQHNRTVDEQRGLSAFFGYEVEARMSADDARRKVLRARFGDAVKLNGELARSEALRKALAEYSEQETLDLRGLVDALPQAELHELVLRCKVAVSIDLSGWQCPDSMKLRSIALSLGARLTNVKLSDAAVEDVHMQDLCSKLYKLERLDLSRCANLGNHAVQAAAHACADSLLELNLEGTTGVDGDALGHLGGTIGAGSRACASLVALNCGGCGRIQDRGLQALGTGCRWLQFASFADCELVGDAGVAGLARGCQGLRVLDVSRCRMVGNASLRSLAEHCHVLRSLNLRGCGRIGDAGLQALSQGCRMLQSLNIASCARVTEGGVCAVAVSSSKTLQLLNMTGCERIAASSLEHLLSGLPFCERAETFFGFKAKPNALEQKLKVQQRVINDAAALNIQAAFRGFVVRKQWQQMLAHRVAELAATQIELAWRSKARVERAKAVVQCLREQRAVVKIQTCRRAYVARCLLEALRKPIRERIAQTKAVTALQAVLRGAFVRGTRQDVVAAIELLRATRWEEVQHAAATCLQEQWVLYHARKRTEAIREIMSQRHRDIALAIVELQRLVRGYRQRLVVRRLFFERQRVATIGRRNVILIQTNFRGYQVRANMDAYREACERAKLFREAAVLYLQAFWRKCMAIEYVRGLQVAHRSLCEYAVKIQMAWRRHSVGGWRHIRYARIKRAIRTQYRLDMLEVRRDVLAKEWKRLDEQGRDSASEDDEKREAGLVEEEDGYDSWEEFYDEESGRPVWFNAKKQVRRYKKPIGYEFEESLISTQVRVYWTMEEQWYPGRITKWNKRHKRHRIDYDDGDHEWIDLFEEQSRVQVLDQDAEAEHWVMFEYHEPDLLRRRRRDAYAQHVQCQAEDEAKKVQAAEEKKQAKKEEYFALLRAAEEDRDKAWKKEWSQEDGMYVEVNSVTGDKRPFLTEAQKQAQELQTRAAAWQQLEDHDSGRVYFYNTHTEETQWDQPADFFAPTEGGDVPMLTQQPGQQQVVPQ